MSVWTQAQAVELCKIIEGVAPKHGGHVALTGGLLYKAGKRKDCDVLIYRIRQFEGPIDFGKLFGDLAMHGIRLVKDHGWCKKAEWNGLPFDVFDPDEEGFEEMVAGVSG